MRYLVVPSGEKKGIYPFYNKNEKEFLISSMNADTYKIFDSNQLKEAILYGQTTDIIDIHTPPKEEDDFSQKYKESNNKMSTLKNYIKEYNNLMCETCLFGNFCSKDSCFYNDRKQVLPDKLITFNIKLEIDLNKSTEEEWEKIIDDIIANIYVKTFFIDFYGNNISFILLNYIKSKGYNYFILLNDILPFTKNDIIQINPKDIILKIENIDIVEKVVHILNSWDIHIINYLISNPANLLKLKNKIDDFNKIYYIVDDICVVNSYKNLEQSNIINDFFQSHTFSNSDKKDIILNVDSDFYLYCQKTGPNFNLKDVPAREAFNQLPINANKKPLIKGYLNIYYDAVDKNGAYFIRIYVKTKTIDCRYLIPITNVKNEEQLRLEATYIALTYGYYFSNIGYKSIINTPYKKINDYYNDIPYEKSFSQDKQTKYYLNNIDLFKNIIWYKFIIMQCKSTDLDSVFNYSLPMNKYSFINIESINNEDAELFFWEKNCSEEEFKLKLIKSNCKFPWNCEDCTINNKPCLCHFSSKIRKKTDITPPPDF